MCGCGRTATPSPGAKIAGPKWSKKMKGPTIGASSDGRRRCTSKPPRSLVCGLRTVAIGEDAAEVVFPMTALSRVSCSFSSEVRLQRSPARTLDGEPARIDRVDQRSFQRQRLAFDLARNTLRRHRRPCQTTRRECDGTEKSRGSRHVARVGADQRVR